MTFEKSIRRLDEIMAALEGEQVGLDASLKLFEEGIELLRAASTELDKAETKVHAAREVRRRLRATGDGSLGKCRLASR